MDIYTIYNPIFTPGKTTELPAIHTLLSIIINIAYLLLSPFSGSIL